MKDNQAARNPIDAIGSAYRDAAVLHAAARLDLFTSIGRNACTVNEIAEKLQATPRGVRILCDALVGLDLLEKDGEEYRNSETALQYLLPDSPTPQRHILLHGAQLYQRWGWLVDAVETGGPVPAEVADERLHGSDTEFARAMADVARHSARELLRYLPLEGAQRLLDIGGGPGLYAIELARACPSAEVVLLDREKTLDVAREYIDEAGVADRVTLKPGDCLTDPLGEGYDFILLSNLVHAFGEATNAQLVAKCAAALAPGGRICIKDFFLDPDRTTPVWSALFAVNMLVNTPEGDCFTVEQAGNWLTRAGLTPEPALEMTPQSRLVFGRK